MNNLVRKTVCSAVTIMIRGTKTEHTNSTSFAHGYAYQQAQHVVAHQVRVLTANGYTMTRTSNKSGSFFWEGYKTDKDGIRRKAVTYVSIYDADLLSSENPMAAPTIVPALRVGAKTNLSLRYEWIQDVGMRIYSTSYKQYLTNGRSCDCPAQGRCWHQDFYTYVTTPVKVVRPATSVKVRVGVLSPSRVEDPTNALMTV